MGYVPFAPDLHSIFAQSESLEALSDDCGSKKPLDQGSEIPEIIPESALALFYRLSACSLQSPSLTVQRF